MFFARLFFKLYFLLSLIKCDIEHIYENYKFDEISTDAILNEENENQICFDQINKFWEFFQFNLDLNKDTVIDSNEFKSFILKQIKKSHQEDITQQISRLDQDKTGKISFKSFVSDAFERTFNDLEEIVAKNSEEFTELINLYKIEKNKWNFISSNSEYLDHSNYYKFIYSEEFPTYNDYESNLRFDTFDLNKDNVIDVHEFKESVKIIDDSLISLKSQKFSKNIDLNHDNYLNRHEFQRWYNPTIDQNINDQKIHIYSWCDLDKDGYLNKTEILNNCKLFLKNQVTNFGIDLLEKNQTSQNSKLKTEL